MIKPSCSVWASTRNSTSSPGARGLYAGSSPLRIFPLILQRYLCPPLVTVKMLFTPKATFPTREFTVPHPIPRQTLRQNSGNDPKGYHRSHRTHFPEHSPRSWRPTVHREGAEPVGRPP